MAGRGRFFDGGVRAPIGQGIYPAVASITWVTTIDGAQADDILRYQTAPMRSGSLRTACAWREYI